MSIIKTVDLTKIFEFNGKQIKALDRVSCEVEGKEIFGLLGPNGAGKTTLIHILSTLVLPTSGTASVLGFDLLREPQIIQNKIGICFGGSRFYWDFTVIEILKYYAKLFGINKSKSEQKINELIKSLGIEEFKNWHFKFLSTGMKQKVAIAKSLLNDPELIFMDEPTAGLDVEVAIEVRNFLRNLVKEKNVTILLTSHNMHEVEVLCKNIALIHKGKLIKQGEVSEIKKELHFPDTIYLLLDRYDELEFIKKIEDVKDFKLSDNGIFIEAYNSQDVVEKIFKELRSRRIKVEDFEVSKASLEEVFLKIIGDTNV